MTTYLTKWTEQLALGVNTTDSFEGTTEHGADALLVALDATVVGTSINLTVKWSDDGGVTYHTIDTADNVDRDDNITEITGALKVMKAFDVYGTHWRIDHVAAGSCTYGIKTAFRTTV